MNSHFDNLDRHLECSVCMESLQNGNETQIVTTQCGHVFHDRCIAKLPNCALCRTKITSKIPLPFVSEIAVLVEEAKKRVDDQLKTAQAAPSSSATSDRFNIPTTDPLTSATLALLQIGEIKNAEDLRKFQQANERVEAIVAYKLGKAYQNGVPGQAKNDIMAFNQLLKAAKLGHLPAMIEVGDCYRAGTGTPKNDAECFKWRKEAADRNDPAGINNLGLCYRLAVGVAEDKQRGEDLYKRAADLGFAEAQWNYANALFTKQKKSNCPEVLMQTCLEYLVMAATQGNKKAIDKLVKIYTEGAPGIKPNAQAVATFRSMIKN